MGNSRFSQIILAATFFLNIGVWTHHFHIALKIAYAFLVGVVTVLGGINQWNVFKKTYPALRIVIVIEHVFTYIIPKRLKKKRHHPSIKNKFP